MIKKMDQLVIKSARKMTITHLSQMKKKKAISLETNQDLPKIRMICLETWASDEANIKYCEETAIFCKGPVRCLEEVPRTVLGDNRL